MSIGITLVSSKYFLARGVLPVLSTVFWEEPLSPLPPLSTTAAARSGCVFCASLEAAVPDVENSIILWLKFVATDSAWHSRSNGSLHTRTDNVDPIAAV